MIVKCNSTQLDKKDCPMKQYCIARLTDNTITGCGIPLWYAGLIEQKEIQVEHTIREKNI